MQAIYLILRAQYGTAEAVQAGTSDEAYPAANGGDGVHERPFELAVSPFRGAAAPLTANETSFTHSWALFSARTEADLRSQYVARF